MKKENFKRVLMSGSALAILGVSILGGGALAKYITTITESDASLQVAKWNITTSGDVLARNSYDEKTIAVNRIAPGTEGTFSVKVNPNNTETGIDYVVSIEKLENKPGNLYFLVDGSSTKIYTAEALGTALSGHLDVGGGEVTHTIQWKWDYETTTSPDGTRTTKEANNEQDTIDGKAAKTMTINYKITATQTQPE